MVCASLFFIDDPRQMAILEQVSLPHSLRTLRRRRLYRVANPQFWWYTCTNARHWQTSAQKEHAVQKSPEAKHPTHAIEQNRRQRPRRRDAHLLKVLHCLRFIGFFFYRRSSTDNDHRADHSSSSPENGSSSCESPFFAASFFAAAF